MDSIISHWQSRTGEQKPLWFVLEKTPWFWAQYFGLLKTPHPLAHPNAASKMRVAWLERLRLALNYFVGRSSYNMSLLPISSPQDLSEACTVLSNDLAHLQLALSAVFVASVGQSTTQDDEDSPTDQTQPKNKGLYFNLFHRRTPSSSTTHTPREHPNASASTNSVNASSRKDGKETSSTHHRNPASSISPSKKSSYLGPPPHPHLNTLRSSSFTGSRHPFTSQSSLYAVASGAAGRELSLPPMRTHIEAMDANYGPQVPPVDDFISLYRTLDQRTIGGANDDQHSTIGDEDEHWRSNSGNTAPFPPTESKAKFERLHNNQSTDSTATKEGASSSTVSKTDVNQSYHTPIRATSDASQDPFLPKTTHSDNSQNAKEGDALEDSEEKVSATAVETEDHPSYTVSEDARDVEEDKDIGYWIKEGQKKMEEEVRRASEILELCRERVQQNQKESFWKREWVRVAVFVGIGGYGLFKLAQNWKWLVNEAKSGRVALVNFFKDHAVEPIKTIWRTIRYDEETAGVMPPENLEAEVNSLVRMVHQWNTDSPAGILASVASSPAYADTTISAYDLATLEKNVRNGVMPGVMEAWESQLPRPIYNALLGDLLRLALIQVQKQKVDLEKAMAQLDRILRQNAINLQIMAALPAILAVLGVSSLLYSYFSQRDSYRHAHRKLRQLIHRAGLLINASSSFYETDLPPSVISPGAQPQLQQFVDQLHPSSYMPDVEEDDEAFDSDPQLPAFPRNHQDQSRIHNRSQAQNGRSQTGRTHHYQQSPATTSTAFGSGSHSSLLVVMRSEHFGELQCVLSQLLDAADTLPASERAPFIADLREIAKPHYSSRQRLTTISRMYYNYPFLNASER